MARAGFRLLLYICHPRLVNAYVRAIRGSISSHPRLAGRGWGSRGHVVARCCHGDFSRESGDEHRHPQGATPMHRIARVTAPLVGLIVTIPSFAADPLVVDLWPGKVPGDVGISRQETSR